MAPGYGQTFRNKDKFIFMIAGAFCYQFLAVIYTREAIRNELDVTTAPSPARDIGTVVRLNKSRETEEHSSDSSVTKSAPIDKVELKTILFWNSFFSQDDYGMGGFGQGPFLRGKCHVNTCETTNDHHKLSEADAVIIHGAYGLPPNTLLPKRAFPKQIFIFYEFEPPALLRFSLDNMNDMFNLTFSYLHHIDTDIYSPYGVVRARRKSLLEKYYPMKPAQILSKRKNVVWIVSDCRPVSKRMEYAKELAKHIDVDIFGKCGRDECPPGKECTDKIEREYKFYLAFENSVCDDYITEKTFRMMYQHHLIPIVLGGAAYQKYVPRNAVIDIRDYQSPAHLAEYLLKISQNDSLFLEYFAWKRHYYVETAPRTDGFCQLCEILHQWDYPYKSEFNVAHYWSVETAHCVTGKEEEDIIHLYG